MKTWQYIYRKPTSKTYTFYIELSLNDAYRLS